MPGATQQELQQVCIEVVNRMQQLQAAHARDFMAYSYSHSDNPQVLQGVASMPYHHEVHGDQAKWQLAKEQNPAPGLCYPEPLRGFQALMNRTGMQEKALQDEAQMVDMLERELVQLKSAIEGPSARKLRECQQRHLKLQQEVIALMAALEAHALQHCGARRDAARDAALEAEYKSLEQVLPTRGQSRLDELASTLRALKAGRGKAAADNPELGAGEQRVLGVLEAQRAMLSSLQDDAKKLTAAVGHLQQGVARDQR